MIIFKQGVVKRIYLWILLSLFLVMVGISTIWYLYPTAFKTSAVIADPSHYDVSADRAYWIKQVKTDGSHKAYQKFLKDNNASVFAVQHERAHVIGEVLFATVGVEGISVCDSSFGFGCFHGLFTRGFASLGVPFIKQADAACIKKYGVFGTGCQHGIGHGLVEYMGHKDINKTLELCKYTSQPTPLLGCTSGVFMEYNTPFTTLPGVEPVPPYTFTEAHPYATCKKVWPQYKTSCYYELGGWWETVLSGNKARMGVLCSRISDTRLRSACALGIGNIIGPTNKYDIRKSTLLCDKTPDTIRTLCYAGVAWSMYSNPEYQGRAKVVCGKLSKREQYICKTHFNLASKYFKVK